MPLLPITAVDYGGIEGSAEFSVDRKLRLRLDRWWAPGPRALVCMANPSTAGAKDNDATIRNLIVLCRALGYPGFTVVNWLPYIATKPADLRCWLANADPKEVARIRELNLSIILDLTHDAAGRFLAWGNLVQYSLDTTSVLCAMSGYYQYDLLAFGVTKDGHPKHPAARGVHRIVPGTPPIVWMKI